MAKEAVIFLGGNMEEVNVGKEYFGLTRVKKSMWHYTSCEALVSIISSCGIRFTDCLFLNDIEEYHYIEGLLNDSSFQGTDEVSKLIQKMKDKVLTENKINFVRIYGSGENDYQQSLGSYYVLSGTTLGDALPMWNYYVKDGNYYGYAIKVDISNILAQLDETEVKILYGPVIYDYEKQIEVIKKGVAQLLEWHRAIKESDKTRGADKLLEYRFVSFIQDIRLFFKSNGFKHEEEYRVVILADENNPMLKKGFASQKGLVKPYMGVSFSKDAPPFKAIRLSPSVEREIGEQGVKQLLSYNFSAKVVDGIEIDKSRIKVRF